MKPEFKQLLVDNVDRHNYKPEFFRLKDRKDELDLEKLLRSDPKIIVSDAIEGQLKELIKAKNPKRVFKGDELQNEVDLFFSDNDRYRYGVWVYYPWSHRLIHLLDEEEFITVRTNRNQYKITPQEKLELAKKKIGVIGLSVGQSIALALSMERSYGELRLADFDILELSNYNRIRTGVNNLDVPKVISTARDILEIDPFLNVKCYPDGITEKNIDTFFLSGGKLDLLVEECDGLYVKILARQKARELGVPVIMDTSDRGMIDIERFDLEPNRPILHGLIDHIDISKVREVRTNEEKVPYLLPMIGFEHISTRMKSSMLEIEQSITTWPQLASSVIMGGGLGADISRRICLGGLLESGRYYIDVEKLIPDKNDKTINEVPLNVDETISNREMEQEIQHFDALKNFEDSIELTKEQVKELVDSAIKAPSGANGQGWKWMYRKRRLYLFLDLLYHAELLDPLKTTTLVGLGSAVENLVLKAHELGLEVKTYRSELNKESKLVSSFLFFKSNEAINVSGLEPHVCDNLVKTIPIRLTNRNVVETRTEIAEKDLFELRDIAKTHLDVRLHLINDPDKLNDLAELTAKLDRIRMTNYGGHVDFRAEIRWTPEQALEMRNGVDLIQTVDLTPSELAGWQIVKDWNVINNLNQWEVGTGFEKLQRKWVKYSSAIGLLTIPEFSHNNFYEAGRALERVWLLANQKGISVHPCSISVLIFNTFLHGRRDILTKKHQIEVEELLKQFISYFNINEDIGQVLLLRFFKSGPPKGRSVRYPLEQVLKFSD